MQSMVQICEYVVAKCHPSFVNRTSIVRVTKSGSILLLEKTSLLSCEKRERCDTCKFQSVGKCMLNIRYYVNK